MKRLIIYLTSLIIITGCAINNKPAPKSNPNLPKVSNFKAYPDRNAMALKWNVVKNISGYYIQRYNFKTKKWQMLKTIKDPFKSLYVDTDLKPATFYKYRIATFDKKGIPSLAIVTSQTTLPTISQVIPLEIKPLNKGMVKIIFRPHQNERVKGYIIQKFNDKSTKWENIANLTPRYNVEYIDKNLKDGKIYKYRIIAYSFDGLKSLPSNILKVSTYPKPPIVQDIKASHNLPKEIKLTWKKVKNAKYYKIYEKELFGFKPIAKTTSTFFIDKVNKDGVKKYYKVTAVSIHDTESLLDKSPEVLGESLPIPAKPLVSTNILNNKIELILSSPDNRAVKYLIIKGKQKYITKSNIFTDTNIQHKQTYYYKIYAVDKYGLISNPIEVKVSY